LQKQKSLLLKGSGDFLLLRLTGMRKNRRRKPAEGDEIISGYNFIGFLRKV
jgi:hypothetical protein